MYSFDEEGNVVQDPDREQLIQRLQRNRQISARADSIYRFNLPAVSHGGLFGFSFWIRFERAFNDAWNDCMAKLRGRSQGVSPSLGNLRALSSKALSIFVKEELQGFPGPVPICQAGANGIYVFLPADGAVLRYLGRLAVRNPHSHLVRMNVFPIRNLTQQLSSIDGSRIRVQDRNVMAINFRIGFEDSLPDVHGSNESSLPLVKRMLEVKEITGYLVKVLQTLSRKMVSFDGSWGEYPKFPIVGAQEKLARFYTPIGENHRGISGNNKELFGDKSVYQVMDIASKVPLIEASSTREGGMQWIHPQPRQ